MSIDLEHVMRMVEELPSSAYPEADAFMLCAAVPDLVHEVVKLRAAVSQAAAAIKEAMRWVDSGLDAAGLMEDALDALGLAAS